ncbi:MAG: outer membrane protein assembly factor BamE [Pseudomonadales bacterium]|uniref:Outer membrane protein assembly factor BamE n=1 Tax=Oleiphilus messinensis TaxID=141451 RepID=A0A1Y0I703_9GAMM|nr:outer membrane protein assembly factor BamE [Oleiphilus messinensis]ARU55556.1 small protein A (tmRNA-binding) [Oleiphilus messinensis]MCG8610062.1 outer membrane protein assembly factor BamE [Pseudomonadales bacterium]
MFRHFFASATLFFTLVIAAGCSFPGVYKINVQQGSIIDHETLEQLKPGMTRRQVHYLLGTPSTPSTFDHQEDAYVYTFQKAGGDIKRQIITVYYGPDDTYTHHASALLNETPAY